MERTHATVCPHNTQIAPLCTLYTSTLHPYVLTLPLNTHYLMLLNHPHRSSSHHFAMQSISWWPNIWPPPPPPPSPCATTGIVMHLTTQLFVIPNLNMVVQASISLWMRKQTLTGEKSYFVGEKEVLTWYSCLFVWQTVWTFELLKTASSTFISNVFQFSWTFTS